MRTRPSIIKTRNGFTLVELIVTIMVAAILGVMFVQIMGTSLTGSVKPLTRAQHMFGINGVMEKMTMDYKKLMAESSRPLATFKTHIDDGYKSAEDRCGDCSYFGPYTIAYNDYISFDTSGDETAGGSEILKVSVADENGEQRLTALFTK